MATKKTPSLPSVEQPSAVEEKPADQSAVATLEPPAAIEPVAPKSAKPIQATVNLVQQMAEQQTNLLTAAEELCRRLAAGELISESERLIFDALKWDQRRIDTETGRLRSVSEWQRQAGTNAELTAAITRRDALSESTPPAVDALRQQIEKLTAEMHVLQETQKRAIATVEGMEAARLHLRKQCPAHVVDAFNRQRSVISGSALAKESREAESRLKMIKDLLNGSHNPEARVHHFKCVGRADQIVTQEHGGHGGHTVLYHSVSDASWQSYLSELRAELPTLEKLFAESKTILDRQLDELETEMLDVYLA